MTTFWSGNIWVQVIVKSWVNLLTCLLIGCPNLWSEPAFLLTQLLTMITTHKFPFLWRRSRGRPGSLPQCSSPRCRWPARPGPRPSASARSSKHAPAYSLAWDGNLSVVVIVKSCVKCKQAGSWLAVQEWTTNQKPGQQVDPTLDHDYNW